MIRGSVREGEEKRPTPSKRDKTRANANGGASVTDLKLRFKLLFQNGKLGDLVLGLGQL